MPINIGNKHIAWKGNVTSPLTFPSLPQHIYIHPCRKCHPPTAIGPETPPKSACAEEKDERPVEQKRKGKGKQKEMHGVGEKTNLYLPS